MEEGDRKDVRIIERFKDAMLWALKIEDGAISQSMQGPLKAVKGKEMDYPLELPEETQP